MDWANVRKYILSHLPNAISPPDEHALYKYNFMTGNSFSPPEAALLLVLTKRLGTRGPGMDELSKAREIVESHCWHRTA